jgi:O-antigen ligase
VLALVPIAGSGLLERLSMLDLGYVGADLEGPGRLAAWQVALGLISQRPLLGHGYGTFAEAFPLLADDRFITSNAGRSVFLIFDYAHNIYLEAAVELGVPAAVALCAAIALLVSLCLRYNNIPYQRRALPLAAAAGSLAVAVHGLVDFSIQIPAVAATYAVILGLGCGQAAARDERPDEAWRITLRPRGMA